MNIVRRYLHAMRLWHVCGLAALAAAGLAAGCKGSDSGGTGPTGGQPAAPDNRQVAFLINGEPVYEDDLAAGLPADAFQETLGQARVMRVGRLSREVPLRQFLKSQNIEVSQQEVDADIAELRKNPPAAGCACCRYQDLDQYIKYNFITPAELERMSRNQVGLRKYLEAEWRKVYPTTEARAAILKEKRPEFEEKYTKAYHIFFMPASEEKRKLAEEAWNRLQKGETFEAVAKAVSEDKVSAAQGGFIGFIPKDIFGKAFADALAQLAPGAYSKPVESTWGCHIIRKEALTDDDLLTVLKNDFQGQKATELRDKLNRERKVEEAGQAPAKGAG